MSIGDARVLLAKAKDDYARSLRAVDAKLNAAVRADPRQLAEAKALQETYHTGFVSAQLHGMTQPAGAPVAPRAPEPPVGKVPPEKWTGTPVTTKVS